MRTSLLAILILACLIGSPALAAEMTWHHGGRRFRQGEFQYGW